jgi:dipeptidyl aminopeptidase/acylaminoacyl peptidase
MKLRLQLVIFLLSSIIFSANAQNFTLEAVKSYAFPTELVRSKRGDKIAWALDEKGVRNIYVAESPKFIPRKLTNYTEDDGQELTSIEISENGKWVTFVRGGDHGSNFDDEKAVNPSGNIDPHNVRVMQVAFTGGPIRVISEGDFPTISPDSKLVSFVKEGQPYICKLDTNEVDDFLEAAVRLFKTRGSVHSLKWSPKENKLAFVADRGDHSFVGYFEIGKSAIKWLDPSFAKDLSPRWSPDGSQIAFVRTSAGASTTDSLTQRNRVPWSIMKIGLADGDKSSVVWNAPNTYRGSFPTTHGGANLFWPKDDRLVFTSYHNGWPHLYSIGPARGTAVLLSPGEFMVEHLSVSSDGNTVYFDANKGNEKSDNDRRHLFQVSVDQADMRPLTPGLGNEWSAISVLGGYVYIGAGAKKAPQVMLSQGDNVRSLTASYIPAEFPEDQLVEPKQVVFKSLDGLTIHGQVFNSSSGSQKKPAIIFVHGGPPRQMLMGWHYSAYYANAYALNQYLANLGFVVLSVNYRLGIGYGYDFQHPKSAGQLGAFEYLDIKGAGDWLADQSFVDSKRIGIYGGSYGGYLTSLGLARDSKLFAAGVDIHGVHNWANQIKVSPELYAGPNKAPDADWAISLINRSSPISSVDTWKSPVLFIHADDDRNVSFSQSIDLINRLKKRKVATESLVIPDDTHHWMKFSNVLKVNQATADYLKAKLAK